MVHLLRDCPGMHLRAQPCVYEECIAHGGQWFLSWEPQLNAELIGPGDQVVRTLMVFAMRTWNEVMEKIVKKWKYMLTGCFF